MATDRTKHRRRHRVTRGLAHPRGTSQKPLSRERESADTPAPPPPAEDALPPSPQSAEGLLHEAQGGEADRAPDFRNWASTLQRDIFEARAGSWAAEPYSTGPDGARVVDPEFRRGAYGGGQVRPPQPSDRPGAWPTPGDDCGPTSYPCWATVPSDWLPRLANCGSSESAFAVGILAK